MYVVYIIDHIHHLLNEPKKSKFAFNSDQREYECGNLQNFNCDYQFVLSNRLLHHHRRHLQQVRLLIPSFNSTSSHPLNLNKIIVELVNFPKK